MIRINGKPEWVIWGEYLIERNPSIEKPVLYHHAVRIAKKKKLIILPRQAVERLIAWQSYGWLNLEGPVNNYWNEEGSVTFLDQSNHISSWSQSEDHRAYVRFAKLFVEDR